MTQAFAIIAVLAVVGGLVGGVGLACVVAPYRGRTDALPWQVSLKIFAATFVAALPTLAVLLGLIDYETPASLALFFAVGAVTGLPLLIAPDRLPRGATPVIVCLALAAVFALTTFFWASQVFREARETLHRACSTATETLSAARSCKEHVDTYWSLPGDLPQT